MAEDVDEPADTKQPAGEQIQNPHADLTFVELMCADSAEKQAQEKGRPLVLRRLCGSADICVGICVCDDDRRLLRCLRLLEFLNLTAACRANNRLYRNLRPAMLAELGLCCVIHNNCH